MRPPPDENSQARNQENAKPRAPLLRERRAPEERRRDPKPLDRSIDVVVVCCIIRLRFGLGIGIWLRLCVDSGIDWEEWARAVHGRKARNSIAFPFASGVPRWHALNSLLVTYPQVTTVYVQRVFWQQTNE